MAAIKALEQWCRTQCEGYQDLAITNMTTSFKNGLAFCAIIHKFRPDLIDYDALNKEDVFKNNSLAFRVAEDKLGIPALLDAEDMVALRVPDRLSILTYVSQYHNYFRGRPPIGGVGGVKRPAEGSKEEPSEKKNLPVVAKTFVSKTAIENRPPASLIAETSPKSPRAADEKAVLVESSNKTSTLNSKCVMCKTHVHLVQRHFVEGKLYHRSCFKCTECSNILLTGAYEAGKEPGTFVCSAHRSSHQTPRNASKPPASGSAIRTGPVGARARPDADAGAAWTAAGPRPCSALSAPVTALPKPADSHPAPRPWTTSAQKTQAARLRFFQSAPEAAPEPPSRPSDAARKETAPLGPADEKNRARAAVIKKLAEENCNNNNVRPFVVRSSEKRFGVNPDLADTPSWRPTECSQSTAGHRAAQPATSNTHSKEPPWLKAINKESTRPTTVSAITKDPVRTEAPVDWRSKLKPVKNGPRLCILGSAEGQSVSLETPMSGVMSSSSPNVTVRTTHPPSPRPPAAPVASPPSWPASYAPPSSRQLPQSPGGEGPKNGNYPPTGSSLRPPSSAAPPPPLVPVWHRPSSPTPPPRRSGGARGDGNGSHSSTKSSSCSPAVKSTDCPPKEHGDLCTRQPQGSTGSKNGKYLSPTNASKSETRSPSSKSLHIPMDEIMKELCDIEDSLSDLEREGVEMERMLRSCEEEVEGDILMDPLMVDWFNLIRKKQMYIRRESELVYTAKTQDLEEQQPGVEGELRRLLEKPDHLKSREERWREDGLMERLVGIVNGRNAIVEGLDGDRLREEEEDQQFNEMMQSLGVRKSKNKRKSSIKKLFRRRSKEIAVE